MCDGVNSHNEGKESNKLVGLSVTFVTTCPETPGTETAGDPDDQVPEENQDEGNIIANIGKGGTCSPEEDPDCDNQGTSVEGEVEAATAGLLEVLCGEVLVTKFFEKARS